MKLVSFKPVHSQIQKGRYDCCSDVEKPLNLAETLLSFQACFLTIWSNVIDTIIMRVLRIVFQVFPSDLFFRQRWNDHRLKHNMSRSLVLMTGRKHVADLLWVPDTVFINSIDSKMHDVMINNNKLDIYPNGDVFWGTRYVFLELYCWQLSSDVNF